MHWLHDPVPNLAQWIGFVATLAGFFAAGVAAWRANRAAEQAQAAKDAAIQTGQLFHVVDLVGDMQELQSIINEKHEVLVAAKADMIRGRIGRFLEEWKSSPDRDDRGEQKLHVVRLQLENISQEAVGSRRKPKNQWARIQIAFGEANQALQSVAGVQRVVAQEK